MLTISDKIQLLGIAISFLTSIIAIFISIATLSQNSKMIEDSTRPYLSIYSASVHVNTSDFYLILKNFGQSSAYIESFTYDFDLAKCAIDNTPGEPFQNIEGSTIVPGQSLRAIIDYSKSIKQVENINFHIKYSSGSKNYEEDICVNLLANSGNLERHHLKKGDELSCISNTLQQINLRNL